MRKLIMCRNCKTKHYYDIYCDKCLNRQNDDIADKEKKGLEKWET